LGGDFRIAELHAATAWPPSHFLQPLCYTLFHTPIHRMCLYCHLSLTLLELSARQDPQGARRQGRPDRNCDSVSMCSALWKWQSGVLNGYRLLIIWSSLMTIRFSQVAFHRRPPRRLHHVPGCCIWPSGARCVPRMVARARRRISLPSCVPQCRVSSLQPPARVFRVERLRLRDSASSLKPQASSLKPQPCALNPA
jgi:hypothetical protein